MWVKIDRRKSTFIWKSIKLRVEWQVGGKNWTLFDRLMSFPKNSCCFGDFHDEDSQLASLLPNVLKLTGCVFWPFFAQFNLFWKFSCETMWIIEIPFIDFFGRTAFYPLISSYDMVFRISYRVAEKFEGYQNKTRCKKWTNFIWTQLNAKCWKIFKMAATKHV